MASLYAAGAVMGWSATDVRASSVWEFWAAWNGYVAAHTSKDGPKLTEDQKVDLFDWISADSGPLLNSTMTYGWDGYRVHSRQVVRW